ncbi:MAG: protein phosphatase 2C domain-containing protein [Hyphomicrobiaceae bacterium]
MMRLDLATEAFIGARSQQQDSAAARGFGQNGGAVLVLADGLGGHTGGAEASRIVVEAFREAADEGAFDLEANRFGALRRALDTANARIGEGADPADGHRGMASTAVAAIIADDQVRWISVGDSHLYLWREGSLSKLNEDHSQAGIMLRTGQFQPGDPEVLAAKSVLVSALTGRRLEIVDHPAEAFELRDGDILVLASDGLNTLENEEIEALLRGSAETTAKDVSNLLIDTVRDRRADRQDNTAVVVARLSTLPDLPRQDSDGVTTVTAIAGSPAAAPARETMTDEDRLAADDAVTQRAPAQRPPAAASQTAPTRPAKAAQADAGAPVETGSDQPQPAPDATPSTSTPATATDAAGGPGRAPPTAPNAPPPGEPEAGEAATGQPPPPLPPRAAPQPGHEPAQSPAATGKPQRARPAGVAGARARPRVSAGLIATIIAGLGIAAAAAYILLTWRQPDADPAARKAVVPAAPAALPARSPAAPSAGQTKSEPAAPAVAPRPTAPAAAPPATTTQPVPVAPPRQLPPAGPAALPQTAPQDAPGATTPLVPPAPQRARPPAQRPAPVQEAPTLSPGADDAPAPLPPGGVTPRRAP